jgi:hypothetical protein
MTGRCRRVTGQPAFTPMVAVNSVTNNGTEFHHVFAVTNSGNLTNRTDGVASKF